MLIRDIKTKWWCFARPDPLFSDGIVPCGNLVLSWKISHFFRSFAYITFGNEVKTFSAHTNTNVPKRSITIALWPNENPCWKPATNYKTKEKKRSQKRTRNMRKFSCKVQAPLICQRNINRNYMFFFLAFTSISTQWERISERESAKKLWLEN